MSLDSEFNWMSVAAVKVLEQFAYDLIENRR